VTNGSDATEELVVDEWDWLAQLLFLASDPLTFAAQESGQLGAIETVFTTALASLLFAELFSHEILSQC